MLIDAPFCEASSRDIPRLQKRLSWCGLSEPGELGAGHPATPANKQAPRRQRGFQVPCSVSPAIDFSQLQDPCLQTPIPLHNGLAVDHSADELTQPQTQEIFPCPKLPSQSSSSCPRAFCCICSPSDLSACPAALTHSSLAAATRLSSFSPQTHNTDLQQAVRSVNS